MKIAIAILALVLSGLAVGQQPTCVDVTDPTDCKWVPLRHPITEIGQRSGGGGSGTCLGEHCTITVGDPQQQIFTLQDRILNIQRDLRNLTKLVLLQDAEGRKQAELFDIQNQRLLKLEQDIREMAQKIEDMEAQKGVDHE